RCQGESSWLESRCSGSDSATPIRAPGMSALASVRSWGQVKAWGFGAKSWQLLYRHTEGVPFFVPEVVSELMQRGALLQQPDGRWERAASEELAVPESVRSVIGQRIAHLAADSLEVLQEASVLGQAFAFGDLQAMGGRSELEVEAALEEAVNIRL